MEYEVLFCIVNSGFAEVVMDVAKKYGATGGTILRARGTANKESEKIFNISIHPEKEIVMILIDKKLKGTMLHALYQNVGLETPGQGIAFTMPVDDVCGLVSEIKKPVKNEENENA